MVGGHWYNLIHTELYCLLYDIVHLITFRQSLDQDNSNGRLLIIVDDGR
ncbi:hypothetical protein SDC9_101113 [bioreactor metagenome]|uniref:Uncharacterized protein n=1 Tax=bioreactor metagenome TaxID=1076179 RepID=A0A645AM81_9ZZZZ